MFYWIVLFIDTRVDESKNGTKTDDLEVDLPWRSFSG